ncbi:MAG: hypothetical protein AAFX54_17940 [Pseudomonadota bacterium]
MTHSSRPTAFDAFAAASKPHPVAQKANRLNKPSPFSLRLSWEERERLERQAGRRSLGAYIRHKLFGEQTTPRRKRRKPRPDDVAIAQALAILGRSRLASNLNQIAKAANTGTLPVGEDLTRELHQACSDIRTMRTALIQALGLTPEDSS